MAQGFDIYIRNDILHDSNMSKIVRKHCQRVSDFGN
jgi:hypothetical protein